MSQLHLFGQLYARPSFIEGVARNLDILNTLREYNESPDESTADNEALKDDWHAVGGDFRSAISSYERTLARSA